MSAVGDETVGDMPVRDVGPTLPRVRGLLGLYQLLCITIIDFDLWLL